MNRVINILIDSEKICVEGDQGTEYKFSQYYLDKLNKYNILSEEDLITFGYEIYSNIFSTDNRKKNLEKIVNELKAQDNLTIFINSKNREIHDIPFEIINIDRASNGFLLKNQNISMLRNIPSIEKKTIILQLPIKILILISMPFEIFEKRPLDPLRELELIYNSLNPYIKEGIVKIDVEQKVNILSLKERLSNENYQIVHIAGYGTQKGAFAFENEIDPYKEKEINIKEFSELFKNSKVNILSFDACKNNQPTIYNPSIAYDLYLENKFSYVIGNITNSYNELIKEDREHIYKRLFDNREVTNIFSSLRINLDEDWWKPVIFGRPDLKIFEDYNNLKHEDEPSRVIVRLQNNFIKYLYRYDLVRQITEFLKENYVVFHGIAGTGKSCFADYFSRLYDNKFKHILYINLIDKQISNPEDLLKYILEQFKYSGYLQEKDFIGKTPSEQWKLLNEKINNNKLPGDRWLLILDDIEIIQDNDGRIKNKWVQFIEEIIQTKSVFVILNSPLRPYILSKQPLTNVIEIGEYTENEVYSFTTDLDEKEEVYFVKNFEKVIDLYGANPMILSIAVEKKHRIINKLSEERVLKDRFNWYNEYFKNYSDEFSKLLILPYSFTYEFMNHIFSKDFINVICNKLNVVKKEKELYKLYPIFPEFFKEKFKINDTVLSEFTRSVISYFKMNQTVHVADCLNIFSVVLDYYDKTNDSSFDETLVEISNAFLIERKYVLLKVPLFERFSQIIDKLKVSKEMRAKTYSNIGGVYQAQGNFDDAHKFYNKALEIKENELGERYHDKAKMYNNIAAVFQDEENFDKAVEYYKKALNIIEDIFGKRHLDTARIYNNIGNVYQANQNYNKALEYYNKSLVVIEDILGKKHIETARSYNNIAGVYFDQCNFDKALEFYLKDLAIREEILGKNHPETAKTYNNIGALYKRKGENERALDFYMKALAIREEVLGIRHQDTIKSYNNIGNVYKTEGKYEKALDFYTKALMSRQGVLGKKNLSTSITYNNIAGIYRLQGKYAESLVYYMKALSLREKLLKKKNLETGIIYNSIGEIYKEQNNYEEAIEYFKRSLAIYKEIAEKKHPDIARLYSSIGSVYKAQNDYNKALKYFNKSLSLFQNLLGNDHAHVARTYNNIAGVYHDKGEFLKALKFFQKAYDIFKDRNDYSDMILTNLFIIDCFIKSNIENIDYQKLANLMNEFVNYLNNNMEDNTVVRIRYLFIQNNTFNSIDIKKLLSQNIKDKTKEQLEKFFDKLNNYR